jgi:hypothetical protein
VSSRPRRCGSEQAPPSRASLVVRQPGGLLPRLQFPTVRTAAITALRFVERGVLIPAIVDDRDVLIWDYPGGDPSDETAAAALTRLRALAGAQHR